MCFRIVCRMAPTLLSSQPSMLGTLAFSSSSAFLSRVAMYLHHNEAAQWGSSSIDALGPSSSSVSLSKVAVYLHYDKVAAIT